MSVRVTNSEMRHLDDVISDVHTKKQWVHYTRTIKQPFTGVRCLSKDGIIMRHNGIEWDPYLTTDTLTEVAVFSTGKIYESTKKGWKVKYG